MHRGRPQTQTCRSRLLAPVPCERKHIDKDKETTFKAMKPFFPPVRFYMNTKLMSSLEFWGYSQVFMLKCIHVLTLNQELYM